MPIMSFPFVVGAKGSELSHRDVISILRVSMKQARQE